MSHSDEEYLKLVRALIAGGHSQHLSLRGFSVSFSRHIELHLADFSERNEILTQQQFAALLGKKTPSVLSVGSWKAEPDTVFGEWIAQVYGNIALTDATLKEDGLHVEACWSDSKETSLMLPFPDVCEAQSFEHYKARMLLKLYKDNWDKADTSIANLSRKEKHQYAVAKHFMYVSRSKVAAEATRLPIVQAIDLSMKLRRRENV